MECDQMRELISAYADGELEAKECAEAERHLGDCGMFPIAENHFGAEGGDAE